MKRGLRLSALLPLLLLLAACEEIDCSLYNSVNMYACFYSDGSAVAITDTLTISTGSSERVLLNRMTNVGNWQIPLSYRQDVDTLLLHVAGDGYQVTDTVWIAKTNTPHFESPDCPTNMFHKIVAIESTHLFIDSVTIVQPYVNYALDENIQLHLHSAP
ncbi:MAG: hypothetical protein K5945_10980 [Bacteroidaceae bacterium]|nr:hypothetical protein [Bacteroidaceae bacterium]